MNSKANTAYARQKVSKFYLKARLSQNNKQNQMSSGAQRFTSGILTITSSDAQCVCFVRLVRFVRLVCFFRIVRIVRLIHYPKHMS